MKIPWKRPQSNPSQPENSEAPPGPTLYQQGFTGADQKPLSSVIGLRTWNWHRVVGLYGYNFHAEHLPWKNGVNTAQCSWVASGKRDAHPVATPECQCGFYAYLTEDINDLCVRGRSQVVGLIRGFGPTTIGTRGFRSSKAEILALTRIFIMENLTHRVDPNKGGTPTPLRVFNYEPNPFHRSHPIYRQYPEARIFPDWQSMLAEFPVTHPES